MSHSLGLLMSERAFTDLAGYTEYPLEEMQQRARDFALDLSRRRTVRDFSDRKVSKEIIENCKCDFFRI